MTKTIQHLLLSAAIYLLTPLVATAQACPDYFRFVDFGRPDAAGNMQPGGTIVRINLDGSLLRDDSPVTCHETGPLFTDGHNHPIPVVSRIDFAPHHIAPNLTALSVLRIDGDVTELAEANAVGHRVALLRHIVYTTRGENFLCAGLVPTYTTGVSCEVTNPFQGMPAFVAYCDAETCEIPMLAIDDTTAITARFAQTDDAKLSIEATGQAVAAMTATINQFFEDKISR